MPAFLMDEIKEGAVIESNGNATHLKDNDVQNKTPKGILNPQNPLVVGPKITAEGGVDTSIERLYDNVCEMHSSNQSSSRSFGSDTEESRIDSELHLLAGETKEIEMIESLEVPNQEGDYQSAVASKGDRSSTGKMKPNKASHLQWDAQPRSKSRSRQDKHPTMGKQNPNKATNWKAGVPCMKKQKDLNRVKLKNETEEISESGLDNPDLGPFLLKQARDLISSGDNHPKALELALRAAKSFEKCMNGGRPSLEFVMCLHVTATIYCSLGQYHEALPILEKSIKIPVIEEGQEHALAKFAGHMQLGDTYAMLGQLEDSILCYRTGLEVQRHVLGETDPQVGETCRYLAEAHVQALQFDEAEKICQTALDIHRDNGLTASVQVAADRRLMGLICEMKGDHEAAVEQLVLARMGMEVKGQETEMASVDCSIGDSYLSLGRYDEAAFAYQKALTVYKSSKGENHPAVASVFVRLADLNERMGRSRESRSYCENAVRIYEKADPRIPPEVIASGLTDVSAIYESMNDFEQAVRLLEKALKMYSDAPGQQSTVAGIEAQMGVMFYFLGDYSNSHGSFKSAISKLRACGEKKPAFLGLVLNQMGLVCVQCHGIGEAVDLFEEARCVLEQEWGQYHPDTLGVYSNLAATYDAIGRLDDAIEMLDLVIGMREEVVGTANTDVEEEKRRLAELLKEAGRAGKRKAKSLETLLDANPTPIDGHGRKV